MLDDGLLLLFLPSDVGTVLGYLDGVITLGLLLAYLLQLALGCLDKVFSGISGHEHVTAGCLGQCVGGIVNAGLVPLVLFLALPVEDGLALFVLKERDAV